MKIKPGLTADEKLLARILELTQDDPKLRQDVLEVLGHKAKEKPNDDLPAP